MKKKLLLFFATAMLSIMGAQADVIPSSYYSTAREATFYLYNVTQQQFMNQEGMSTTPTRMTLQDRGNGTYSIKADNGNYEKVGHHGGNFLWCNTFSSWDEGNARSFFMWTFTPTGTGTYKLSVTPTANDPQNGYNFTAGTTYYFNTRQSITKTEAEANEWALISLANYTAYVNSINLSIVDDATVTTNKTTMTSALGDATASMIVNSTFDDNGDGWNGGTRTTCNTWRGTGNADYESTTNNVTFYKVLNNMPAGTYKVVAAVRGDGGTSAIAQLGGVNISSMTETIITNDAFSTSRQQINLNGVQMPWSGLGGFSTLGNSLGWQWITATATFTSSSNIIVAFTMLGGRWKGIDDVHLYYMNDGTTDYAMSFSDNIYIDERSHAITCDIQTDNPNRIFKTYDDFYTISGQKLKNDLLVKHANWIGDVVLYDGYKFDNSLGAAHAVTATLYRRVEANAFATICVPFGKVNASGIFYQPASLTDGTLNFETTEAESRPVGRAYLFKAGESAVTSFTAGWCDINASPVDNGSGVIMKGTYTNIAAVPTDDYVLSGMNLYKVNSTVTLAPFRAYFTIPEGGSEARIALSFDDEPTGISDVRGKKEDVRGIYYDLQGRSVIHPTKGLYIVNGKKVMVK